MDQLSNLALRFPIVDRDRIQTALLATKGHGGNAAKLLRAQGCKYVPKPSQQQFVEFNHKDPFQHFSEGTEVSVTARVPDSRPDGSRQHGSHELQFRKQSDFDGHVIRFDLTRIDGIQCATRTRYDESLFVGSYLSFSCSIDGPTDQRGIDILRFYIRDLRKDHSALLLHGESVMLWLKEMAIHSASVLRVSSTTEAVGFYERYMPNMGDGMFLFDGTKGH